LSDLFSSVEDLIAVLEQRKRLIMPCMWVEPEKSGQRGLKLKAPLQSESAALRGVTLEVGCHNESFELPSRVVLMVEFKGRSRAMARIDINGSKHENPKAICGEWHQKDAGRTHFHDTRLHNSIQIADLLSGTYGDLPVARPINDMPNEFSKAMEKCGELLHIENLGEIEEPQWQPRQFPF
jgi:hypothetical protein